MSASRNNRVVGDAEKETLDRERVGIWKWVRMPRGAHFRSHLDNHRAESSPKNKKKLLMAEINHRSKTLLSVVQAQL